MEVTLKELAEKQADLERREKELEETQRGLTAAPSSIAGIPILGINSGAKADDIQTTAAAATAAAVTSAAGVAGGTAAGTAQADVALAAVTPQNIIPHIEGVEQAVESDAVVAGAAEWVEYWDESAGASYFFNTVTQVCQRRDEPARRLWGIEEASVLPECSW